MGVTVTTDLPLFVVLSNLHVVRRWQHMVMQQPMHTSDANKRMSGIPTFSEVRCGSGELFSTDWGHDEWRD